MYHDFRGVCSLSNLLHFFHGSQKKSRVLEHLSASSVVTLSFSGGSGKVGTRIIQLEGGGEDSR